MRRMHVLNKSCHFYIQVEDWSYGHPICAGA